MLIQLIEAILNGLGYLIGILLVIATIVGISNFIYDECSPILIYYIVLPFFNTLILLGLYITINYQMNNSLVIQYHTYSLIYYSSWVIAILNHIIMKFRRIISEKKNKK